MSELYNLITSRENLYKAAKRALKGKLSNARFYSYFINLSNNVEYKNLKKNKVDSLQSCLGHALKTSSYSTLIKRIKTKRPHLLPLLTIQKIS